MAAMLSMAAGAEEIKEYTLDVGQFDKLNITDDVNVVYRCRPDSTGLVSYKAESDFADAFIFTNKKGTLKIQVNTEDVGKPGLPTLYVYSDFLTEVTNSSNYVLTVEEPAPTPVFKIKQIGNGKIEVEEVRSTTVNATLATGNGTIVVYGTCQKADLTMVGNGLIQADLLKAADVSCKILGAGSIGCWPVANLDVRGIGSTRVYYKGDPVVKKVGGGKLFPLTGEMPGE